MYLFVKLIHERVESFQKSNPDIANTNQHFHPSVKDIVDEYAEKYNLSYNTAQDICRDVIDSKWIDEQYKIDNNKKVPIFCKNRKSRQIVEGVLFFRPGLFNEWMKEFGQTLTILIAFLALIISVFAIKQ